MTTKPFFPFMSPDEIKIELSAAQHKCHRCGNAIELGVNFDGDDYQEIELGHNPDCNLNNRND